MKVKEGKPQLIKLKWVLLALLAFVLYLVIGALAPFALQKEPTPKTKEGFSAQSCYGNGSSRDRACVVEDNQEALDLRLAMFASAKERIVLSTFDIRPGKSWDQIAAALIHAADRGVQVQILVDGMYGMIHMKREPEFYAVGTHKKIEIKFYNPVNLLLPWTFNGRLHDKYILVDDSLLLAGGRNTFDYFLLNSKKDVGYDREVFVLHEEDSPSPGVIAQVDEYFQKVWNLSCSRLRYHKPPHFGKKDVGDKLAAYRAAYGTLEIPAVDYHAITTATDQVTFLHNPTNILGKEPVLFYQLCTLMKQAKKDVFIQTPYANFSKYMYSQMTELADLVPDTKMMINSVAVGDNVMASSDYLLNKEKVWATGVQTYEYFGAHSSHGKSILIDDDISIVGSYNFDMRSTYLDTETMLVIHGKDFQKQLAEEMNDLLVDSLLVAQDGTYVPKEGLLPKETDPGKKRLYSVLGPVLQPLRYLV